MNKIFSISFILLLLAINIIQAEKIGYINIEKVFQEYNAMSDVQAQLQQLENEWWREAELKKQDWMEERRSLENEAVTLSEEEISRRTRLIEQKRQEYESYVQEIWGEGGLYQRKTEEFTASPIAQINEVVQEIAETEEYTLIINALPSLILYAQPGLDLTDQVLSRLNAEYVSIVDTTEQEKMRTAILSVVPITADAKSSGISSTINSYLQSILDRIATLEIVEGEKVTDALQQIGVTTIEDINQSQLASLAAFLEAEYIVRGTISQDQDQFHLIISVFSASMYTDLIVVEDKFQGVENLENSIEALVADLASSM